MTTEGYVFLHRKILESTLWELTPTQIIVAQVCLLKAQWRDTQVRGFEVKRGEWLTHYQSIKSLCSKHITVPQVRHSIKRLASQEVGFLLTRVVTRFGRRYMLISICNYEIYQTPQAGVVTGVVTGVVSRVSDEYQTGITTLKEEVKEVKEVKKEEYISPVAFQEYWNSHPELQQIRVMTASRKKQLAIRAKANDFRHYWKDAVDAITQRGWMIGKGNREWRADIKWFLANDSNWLKGLEQVDGQEARVEYSREKVKAEEKAILERADQERGKDNISPEAQAFVDNLVDKTGVHDG